MWEELVGLKSQALRPNLSASFPLLLKTFVSMRAKKLGFLGGVLKRAKTKGKKPALDVWTKPNGIFGPRNVQGFIGGNPRGLGGRDHSVSFSRLFILSCSFCCHTVDLTH